MLKIRIETCLQALLSRHRKIRHESIFFFIATATVLEPRWWSQAGSNRRPPACKAGALPAELWPHDVDCQTTPEISNSGKLPELFRLFDRRGEAYFKYASRWDRATWAILVGLGRFELPTSPLSGVRSNQLSYRPVSACPFSAMLRCFSSSLGHIHRYAPRSSLRDALPGEKWPAHEPQGLLPALVRKNQRRNKA